ncbi:ubiquinone/menaquinone biosynthesis methyltransferase [Fusobacterium gonidiaformans 3-1-5R]|uniref:Demethylmenaquinone methyltransferase n=1 Tax=Fusobacterium gonidiaformans 3-1-5R TaxID=469605 RepID=E5BGC6_9FUSO|nr:ubiquinone/menaquinone biosynthesis methyltransferase [Fusobacterium gonidiaformans]EFS21549.1 ubiquinone/menaquinone biosynthesis methyltransferase [Fusobacterium gonidiaformans 3-1-5R]
MKEEKKSEKVHGVFETISKEYDKANDRISLGFQRKWKGMLVQKLLEETEKQGRVLDVCCGTGDISIWIAKKRNDLNIVGLDFSSSMLREAEKKSRGLSNILWKEGDAMALPFEEHSFSAACISFGLRNTADYEMVLREMKRVLKEDGILYCLDSFVPDNRWIRPCYQMYFKYMMPFLGGGKKHYQEYFWLYESTQQFLRKQELLLLYQKLGLRELKVYSKMYGACVLIQGKKE